MLTPGVYCTEKIKGINLFHGRVIMGLKESDMIRDKGQNI